MVDTKCITCTDTACTTIKETFTASQITFDAVDIPASKISITTDKTHNGDTAATVTFKITTSNPIVVNGALKIEMPKTNNNYKNLGRMSRVALLTNSDIGAATTSVRHGSIGSTSLSTITVASRTFQSSTPDVDHDTLFMSLSNRAAIASNSDVYITLSPCINPPSLQPLTGFKIITGEYASTNFFYTTEIASGGSLTNAMAGEMIFQTNAESKLEITSATTMVSTKDATYKFTLYIKNDVPRDSSIYI